MLHFNGIKFARNDKEMTDSLFQSDGTCCGYYKRHKDGFKLFKQNGELFAFVDPIKSILVSASTKAGKSWYSYGLSDTDATYLRLTDVTYRDQDATIKATCEE